MSENEEQQSPPTYPIVLGAVALVILVSAAAAIPSSSAPRVAQPPASPVHQEIPAAPDADPKLRDLLADTNATVVENSETFEEEEIDCLDDVYTWNPHNESKEIGRGYSRYGASHRAEEIFESATNGGSVAMEQSKGSAKRNTRKSSANSKVSAPPPSSPGVRRKRRG